MTQSHAGEPTGPGEPTGTGAPPSPDTPPDVDYSRKWFAMAVVSVGILLATIDSSIVNVALPTLVDSFDTDFQTVQWVVLAYLLVLTALMVSVGRVADMRGRKRIYTWGFVVFTVGSVLCGLAQSVYWLIAFRLLQAVGASMILALGMAIVTGAFPRSERGKALGITGAMVSVGIVIGPTLGGVLIGALSWRWIFFVNLPVGIVGTLMAIAYLPETKAAGGQKFDLLGAVLLFVSLLALLVALTSGQTVGFTDPKVLALLAGSALFTTLFALTERRVEQPIVDLRLLGNRLFSIGLSTGFITFVAIAGAVILMPFYLQGVLGYTPLQIGVILAAVPIALGITAPISGTLSDRLGTRPIAVAGLAVLFVGYVALSSLRPDTSAAGFVVRFLPLGVGMGLFQSPNTSAIMGTAPVSQLGVVSGVMAMTRTLGQSVGIAVLGAVWASRVAHYAGGTVAGGATEAAAPYQTAALSDTMLLMAAGIAVALALAVWSWWADRR